MSDDSIQTVGELRDRVRGDPTYMAVALGVAALIGLGLATIHWYGLIVGGALVGLVSRSLPAAVLGALGFGVLVLVAFAALAGGTVSMVPDMAPAVYLLVGSALGLPVLGSLVRGIV